MAFIALVDGLRARCLIRAEALVELAQESAMTPIRTFSEHREAVEDLARELIQNGRLDGRELVIRLCDVQESRAPVAIPLASQAQVPFKSPPAELLDGRRMTMPEDARLSVWRDLCDRQNEKSKLFSRNATRELTVRALEEAGVFGSQAAPKTAHELNLRRGSAGRMTASWNAERSRVRLTSHPADRRQ
jgi:hypothetical protein